jgi:hypothetical protein
MQLLTDTPPEIDSRIVDAYRRMPIDRKWRNLGEDWVLVRQLHMAGFRQRNPQSTAADIRQDWLRQTLGDRLSLSVPDSNMDLLPFAPVLRTVLRVFDKLGIAYAIGGSIASSLHGIGRMTRDADVSVEPFPGKDAALIAALDPNSFYVSDIAVRDAVRDQSSFNIIHPESGFKVDVFVLKNEPFEQSAFRRRQFLTFADDPAQSVAFYVPEDVVLFKLRWHRMGGESSDQQWNDILGILRTQAERIDTAYLDQWSTTIGVADLWDRARGEA